MSKISYLKFNMLYLTVVSHFDRINFSSVKKIPTVTVAGTRYFTILQSKQQTWRMHGAGEGRVFDDI